MNILLVGNKVDLLPKSVNKTKLNHWMRRSLKEMGLKKHFLNKMMLGLRSFFMALKKSVKRQMFGDLCIQEDN